MKSYGLFTFLFLLTVFSIQPQPVLDSGRPARVKLQLKWKHQFQFAGYYAAIEKGFYKEAGLEVELIEARPGIDPIQSVLDGKADFGVGTTDLVLHRKKGQPVVVLAVIFSILRWD